MQLLHRYRLLVFVLLLIYGATLLHLWFFLPGRDRYLEKERTVNLVPLERTVYTFYRAWHSRPEQDYLRRNFNLHFFGNLALFIPLGLLLPLAHPVFTRFWPLAGLAFGLSLAGEWVQYLTQRGEFDVDDILLNVAGALVGWMVIWVLGKNWRKRFEDCSKVVRK